jgi:hypothetical protein
LELAGGFLREIVAILSYALIFFGVYKLFQIATDLREIKETLKGSTRPAPGSTAAIGDDASAYAERLVRAVNAESYGSGNTPESAQAASLPSGPAKSDRL